MIASSLNIVVIIAGGGIYLAIFDLSQNFLQKCLWVILSE